jgi:[ribosomal protein S5]-alanine N-acetyltransferase
MKIPERFRTRRLLLARIERSDLGDLMRMHDDPRVVEMLGGVRPANATALIEELAGHWDRPGYGWWIARDPDSGRFLGRGGLRPVVVNGASETELAYGFLPEYWGHGFATELARVAVAQGFVRIGLRDVIGLTLPGNPASRRVMEKSGFAHERDVIHAGMPHILYRLKAETWRTAPLTGQPVSRPQVAELQAV